MSRTSVAVRPALEDDLPFLVELWAASLRRAEPEDQARDLGTVLRHAAVRDEERVLVAEHGGVPAGAVFLRLGAVGVLNPDPVVQIFYPTVLPHARRHGVGRALIEAAVAFAEETGAVSVAVAAAAGSREANRFMARMGFAPTATYRTASTARVRSHLAAGRTTASGTGRPIGRVLAARRSMRRAEQSAVEEPTP